MLAGFKRVWCSWSGGGGNRTMLRADGLNEVGGAPPRRTERTNKRSLLVPEHSRKGIQKKEPSRKFLRWFSWWSFAGPLVRLHVPAPGRGLAPSPESGFLSFGRVACVENSLARSETFDGGNSPDCPCLINVFLSRRCSFADVRPFV